MMIEDEAVRGTDRAKSRDYVIVDLYKRLLAESVDEVCLYEARRMERSTKCRGERQKREKRRRLHLPVDTRDRLLSSSFERRELC
jgi:hypothetical protein